MKWLAGEKLAAKSHSSRKWLSITAPSVQGGRGGSFMEPTRPNRNVTAAKLVTFYGNKALCEADNMAGNYKFKPVSGTVGTDKS